MTSIILKLEEIYVNLKVLYNALLFLEEIDRLTYKSWVRLFWGKSKFYNIFQLWLQYVKEMSGDKLQYLQTNDREEFINLIFQRFCNEKYIDIGYTI